MATYRVVGSCEVLGHKPDETFSADLPKVQEARLLAAGALEVAKPTPAPVKPGTDTKLSVSASPKPAPTE